ncbi:hypothetical protein CDAR_28441 [Caerostris darwini]|uniref:Uncharacterized protein n=1 Tax=Caerostris darwini TaxID=1538125 RepID=A0AAV4Q4X1_9ARAC|nr:hypothetical protein CDAR_28441 [Caerostris darwini]
MPVVYHRSSSSRTHPGGGGRGGGKKGGWEMFSWSTNPKRPYQSVDFMTRALNADASRSPVHQSSTLTNVFRESRGRIMSPKLLFQRSKWNRLK